MVPPDIKSLEKGWILIKKRISKMKYQDYIKKLSEATGVKRAVLTLLVIMVVCNLFLTLTVAFTRDRVRTIITPATIDQKMWVDDEKASKEYLQEMSTYFAQLMFNVSPMNIEARHSLLLSYISSEKYSAFEKELKLSENLIRQTNIATYFVPTHYGVDEKSMTVVLRGSFIATQGEKVMQRAQKELELKFKFDGGKLLIDRFVDKSETVLRNSIVIDETKSTEVNPTTGKVVEKQIDQETGEVTQKGIKK